MFPRRSDERSARKNLTPILFAALLAVLADPRTILRAFSNYTLLIHHHRLGREVQPTRLSTRQREILQQLGFSTPAQILSRRLPRAPT